MSVEEGRASKLPGVARLLDLGERMIFVGALIAFYYGNVRSHDPVNILNLANNAITVAFIVFRRPTVAVSRLPADWGLALIGTIGAMFLRPGGGAPLAPEAVAAVIAIQGFVVQLYAKASLNRRFGIAPANRGIQARWAYGLVRHPMYLGYFLIQVAYLLINPSRFNLAVIAVTWACQVGRMLREERFLLNDPAYRTYAERVRYRILPLLF